MNRISLLIIALLLLSCGSEHGLEQAVEPTAEMDIRQIMADNPEVSIGPLEIRTVDTRVLCNGKIEIPPSDFLSIHSKTAGFVDELYVLPGEEVRRGAKLVSIVNPALIEKQRLFAETYAELKQSESELKRQETLSMDQATSLRKIEEVQSRHELLKARYEGLKSELKMIGIDTEGVTMNQNYQTKVTLYAQQNGWVHTVKVNKGQMINPENALMEMANSDHIHLELSVLAKDVSLLEIGQEVLFEVPQGKEMYKAKIVNLNPMLNNENGTLMVHCHIEKEHNEKVKAGMYVQAQVVVGPKELAGLPLNAVVKEGDIYYAYAVNENSVEKVQLEQVELYTDFLTFKTIPNTEFVTSGAYYLE